LPSAFGEWLAQGNRILRDGAARLVQTRPADSRWKRRVFDGRCLEWLWRFWPLRAINDQSDGHEDDMEDEDDKEQVTLARAKAHLSKLVERAARGEPVRITRRGKAVARLTGIERQPRSVDLEALQALTRSMPMQPEPARSWLRSVRDESRY
jgi:prevent-host-death family protein